MSAKLSDIKHGARLVWRGAGSQTRTGTFIEWSQGESSGLMYARVIEQEGKAWAHKPRLVHPTRIIAMQNIDRYSNVEIIER